MNRSYRRRPAVAGVERVILIDANPWQRLPSPRNLVALARILFLRLKEVEACGKPFFACSCLVVDHRFSPQCRVSDRPRVPHINPRQFMRLTNILIGSSGTSDKQFSTDAGVEIEVALAIALRQVERRAAHGLRGRGSWRAQAKDAATIHSYACHAQFEPFPGMLARQVAFFYGPIYGKLAGPLLNGRRHGSPI